jgi:hypothetical protein
LLQRQKKSNYLLCFYYFLFCIGFFSVFFWAFQQREIKNTKQNFSPKKKRSGSSQKTRLLFIRFFLFFSPSVVWFDFFYCVFGRFVTRRVKKRDKKNGAKISSAPEKIVTYLRYFFFPFPRCPLVCGQSKNGDWGPLIGLYAPMTYFHHLG